MKPWQRGIPLDELKEVAALFKGAHGAHVYGAFGLVKERDIAAAMADGAYYENRNDYGLDAACITHKLARGSTQRDFTGARIRLPAGTLYVQALAARKAVSAELLLDSLPAMQHTYIEIFMEDHVARAVMARGDFEYVATKVLAGSEIKGLYRRRALLRSTPAQKLAALPVETAAEDATLLEVTRGYASDMLPYVIKELQAVTAWAQHYSSYNKGKSWTALALRGYDASDPTFIIKPFEMSKRWQRENPERMHGVCSDTTLADKFPMTMALVNSLPGLKDRVRFMRLAPGGGELTRHADITDRVAGVRDGYVARMHIPIITNQKVTFTAWDKFGTPIVRNFPAGALCYLDQRKPHCVVNAGHTERIHLVVDCRSNGVLRALLASAYNKENKRG